MQQASPEAMYEMTDRQLEEQGLICLAKFAQRQSEHPVLKKEARTAWRAIWYKVSALVHLRKDYTNASS